MNKTAIKNFAIWARNKLIADICYRAGLMGITEKGIADALPQSTREAEFYDFGATEPYMLDGDAIKQRRQLVSAIREKEADTDYATAYQYIMEEVAYTWFNRLIAVRFMEVNDYLPSHLRVLSSESGKVEPDLVTTPFDAELPFTAEEEAQIIQWKQDNKLDELFRFLFIKQCNALNEILPGLFEKTTDYTEVLLNLSVVDQEGVVYKLTHDIPEKDFNIEQGGQVEIIGWLYQYYNTEPKKAAFEKSGKITKEEIPAVTQLFTPDWIVRYMVENSLGRLWLEGHPDSDLRKNWKYYLDEAPQEPQVQAKLAEIRKEYAALNPEDLTLIDPCMGSGHILVYAFDVLMQIYTSVGYSERDAAKSILEHNLYGLDIDDRAYQLAYFAVMMKARQYNRRILNGENTCHVYAIQESNSINRAHLKFFGAGLSDLEKNTAKMQLEGLLDILTDAKEYGSILNVPEYNWALLRRFVDGVDDEVQISLESAGVEETAEELAKLIDLGETMARKYWVTCTNPPYAGTSNLSARVNNFVKKYYPDSKADLFAVFIERCRAMTADNGYQAMITQHSWMFLSSFEKLREKMMLTETVNMAHLGARAFEEIGGEVVQTTAFVRCANHVDGYKGTYCRLIEPTSQQGKEEMFLAGQNRYTANQDDFAKIPGAPVAYWVSEKFTNMYKQTSIAQIATTREGMTTADNDQFVRLWEEVNSEHIAFGCTTSFEAQKTNRRWFPYAKGGDFRKWYGNSWYVVDWQDDGWRIRNFKDEKTGRIRSHNYNLEYIFRECLSWTRVTSGNFCIRYYPKGYLCDTAGAGLFVEKDRMFLLGWLSTNIVNQMLQIQNPTIVVQAGDVARIPVPEKKNNKQDIENLVEDNISISKEDWDSFETSWDFKVHPLVFNDLLIKVHAHGQGADVDIFIQAVNALILLLVDVQRRKTDAVVAYVLVILGIGAARHHIRAHSHAGIDFPDGLLHQPESVSLIVHHRTGIVLIEHFRFQIEFLRHIGDEGDALIRGLMRNEAQIRRHVGLLRQNVQAIRALRHGEGDGGVQHGRARRAGMSFASSGLNSHRLANTSFMPKAMFGVRRRNISSTAGLNLLVKGVFFSTAAMNWPSRTRGVFRPGAEAWPPLPRAMNFRSP